MKKRCIKQCALNEDDVCTGCKRTLKEITEAGNINKAKRKAYAKDTKENSIL